MKISKIYLPSKNEFKILVSNSFSYSEILKKLQLNISNGNYKTLKRRINEENISCFHFKKIGIRQIKHKLHDVLIQNSPYINTNSLKERLLREGLLVNKCSSCGINNNWNGNLLSLQMDHINGVSNDNRIENLCILCPNCHSQTKTYAGKSLSKGDVKCIDCNILISKKSKRCKSCATKYRENKNTKIIWPKIEDLLSMLKNSNFIQVALKLGVSDNAIRKRIKKWQEHSESNALDKRFGVSPATIALHL